MSSEPTEYSVKIGLRDIYNLALQTAGKVDMLLMKDDSKTAHMKDLEDRLRSVERARWPLPSVAILLSVAVLIRDLLSS